MEELNKGYEFTKAQIAELESLRAWKAEIEKQEPVAVIGNDYQLLYVGSGPLAPLVLKHGLKVGSKLFAAPVVSQQEQPRPLPFAILPNEMADLQRFHECAMDDEGYDVPKERMKRLAEIGLVRRVSANYHEHTLFGLSVLNGDFSPPVVSLDVEKLKAEIAELKASRGLRHVQQLKAENQSLKTELEAARKDAERYRWLRSFHPGLWLDGITLEPIENEGYALQLDSAIDAAIEQAKGGV